MSIIVDFKEKFEQIENCAAASSCASPWGNSYIVITEDDIAALRTGKILFYTDGDYGTFVKLKVKMYVDKNGTEIKAGMTILTYDERLETVYETTDANGLPDLGISATTEKYLAKHPDAEREYYSLSNYDADELEIISKDA